MESPAGELLLSMLGAPNTIVILTADNSAWLDAYPDAGTTPFRGEKGSSFEGGWRVPGIIGPVNDRSRPAAAALMRPSIRTLAPRGRRR
jgi:arylsulfatase A-like enzyme